MKKQKVYKATETQLIDFIVLLVLGTLVIITYAINKSVQQMFLSGWALNTYYLSIIHKDILKSNKNG